MTADSCCVLFRPDGAIDRIIGPISSETARVLAEGFTQTRIARYDGKPVAIAVRMEKP